MVNFDFVPTARPLSCLIEELTRLPGIGPKSGQRLAYYILRSSLEQAKALADAILAVKEQVVLCSVCQNVTDKDPCILCNGRGRDASRICVVEEPLDVLALERSHVYGGQYHVLHGVISPANGIGPEELKLKELLSRLKDGQVKEVILATNPNIEGEATAMYLRRLISPLGIKVTRLALGLPFGGDLEYADETTLAKALEGRQEY